VSLVFFRGWLKQRLARAEVPRVDDTLAGEIGVASEALAPGAVGSVELRGTVWSARNVGEVALESGARVRVERVEGLTLQVRREI
jgi:inner membrane protein